MNIYFLRLMALTLVAFLARGSVAFSDTYNFFDTTNEHVATIEFSSLPATHNEIIKLTFTPYGDSLLGLGLEYTGDFDMTGLSIIDDGNSGLTTTTRNGDIIADNSPPNSTNPIFPPETPPSFFWLYFDGSFTNQPPPTVFGHYQAEDSLFLASNVFGQFSPNVEVLGAWLAIPEPTAALTMCLGLLFFEIEKRRIVS